MTVVFEADFPESVQKPFIKTSEVTPSYNCIAWAAGDSSNWYEPDPMGLYYWPPNVPRQYSIVAYIQVYESIGYIKCDNENLEEGYEKVAVFGKKHIPTHAAKQLSSGLWSSKLGKDIDVSHTIDGIENGLYGNIVQYLKRKKEPNI